MGFYIQDDYYRGAASEMTRAEQDAFFGALVRHYFDGSDESGRIRSKTVRIAYKSVVARVDMARKEAEKKRRVRGQSPGQTRGQTGGQSRGQKGGQNPPPLKESESEKEREIVDVDVLQTPMLVGPDEIASEPEGFAAFMAGGVKAFNAATGQAYAYPTAKARQGMLDAFRAGRTLDDVDRVMADVATWPREMQTLNAVFADGKFEAHLNRGGGGERRDWSQFNDLAV